MAHFWNLADWMQALGIKRPDQPDVAHIVQPVSIVGDHSGFAAQILPPTAWMGGARAAVIAVFSAFQLRSASPGGTYVRWLELGVGGAAKGRWHITTAPGTLANLIAPLVVNDMGSLPTVSRVQLGTLAAQPFGATVPQVEIVSNNSKPFSDFAFIPPGSTLEMWCDTANNAIDVAVLFEDAPAQRSTD